MEHFTQFIADQIYNGLEIQLGGESLLNGVDDLQFGIPLAGFLDGASARHCCGNMFCNKL